MGSRTVMPCAPCVTRCTGHDASQGPPGPSHDTPSHEPMTDTTPRRERLDRAAANARVRRYRLRKAGLLPPLARCPACGGQVRAGGPLCCACWRLTDEGRRWNRERMRKRRAEVGS